MKEHISCNFCKEEATSEIVSLSAHLSLLNSLQGLIPLHSCLWQEHQFRDGSWYHFPQLPLTLLTHYTPVPVTPSLHKCFQHLLLPLEGGAESSCPESSHKAHNISLTHQVHVLTGQTVVLQLAML